MFVVFDTNVWQAELALNSPSGAAVRFYLHRHNAIVAMPEVVRLELERNLKRTLLSLADRIKKAHSEMLAIFGTLKEVVLPTESQIEEKVAQILSNCGVKTREVPFSFDAAKFSFIKIIEKSAPSSDKDQQFKDGVIWANCVELLAEADVYLVTSDKGFFEGRQYTHGLAKNLQVEADACKHKLKLFSSLDGLLKSIQINVQLDKTKLVDAFLSTYPINGDQMLEKAGFATDQEPEVETKLFATEEPSRLYVRFVIRFRCSDLKDLGRSDAMLELVGDGSYDTSSGGFSGLRKERDTLTYTDSDGQQKIGGRTIMVGSAIIGHRSVHHTLEVPLLNS